MIYRVIPRAFPKQHIIAIQKITCRGNYRLEIQSNSIKLYFQNSFHFSVNVRISENIAMNEMGNNFKASSLQLVMTVMAFVVIVVTFLVTVGFVMIMMTFVTMVLLVSLVVVVMMSLLMVSLLAVLVMMVMTLFGRKNCDYQNINR